MLNGFNDQTAPLTGKELEAIPTITNALSNAKGKANAIYNQRLQRLTGFNSARIRKCINYIRTRGLVECLIATSKGYYIADTEKELLEYEDSLLCRATSILDVKYSISEQRKKRFSPEQLTLF